MMNKFLYILIFILTGFLLSINAGFPQKATGFYQIHQIKENKLASGIYNTEGFVVKIYTCPPCPKSGLCEPCQKDHIVISVSTKNLNSYYLSKSDLIVFTKDSKKFKLGKKYRFAIKVLNTQITSESINNIEIVNYKLLK